MFKKIKQIRLFLLCSLLLLVSCTNEFTQMDDDLDFEISSQNNNSKVIQQGYNLFVTSDMENLVYTGEQMEIGISLVNTGGEFDIGFQIYADGIPLEISIEDKTEHTHYFYLSENSVVNFTASYTPIGKSGDVVAIQPVGIFTPHQKLDNENKFYGNAQRILTTSPYSLTFETDSQITYSTYEVYENILITKETESQFNVKSIQGRLAVLFKKKNNLDNDYIPSNEFTFLISGAKTGANYRVVFFVNNVPVKINGGYDCLSVYDKQNYFTVANINLDVPLSEFDTVNAIISPLGSDFQILDTYIFNSKSYGYYPFDIKIENEVITTTEHINADLIEIDYNYIFTECIDVTNDGKIYVTNRQSILALVDRDLHLLKTNNSYSGVYGKVGVSKFDGGVWQILSLLVDEDGNYLTYDNFNKMDKYDIDILKLMIYDDELNVINDIEISDNLPFSSVATVSLDGKFVAYLALSSEDYKFNLVVSEISNGSLNNTQNIPISNIFISEISFGTDGNTIAFTGSLIDSGKEIIGYIDILRKEVNFIKMSNMNNAIKPHKNGFLFSPKFKDGNAVLMDFSGIISCLIFEENDEVSYHTISPNNDYYGSVIMADGDEIILKLYDMNTSSKIFEKRITNIPFSGISFIDNDGNVYISTNNGIEIITRN